MSGLKVTVACGDDGLRMAVARAFDRAPLDWDIVFSESAIPSGDVVVSVGQDLPGAIRFDPAEPDKVITDILARRERTARKIVSVFGATGGCGATSVALHLAASCKGASCLATLEPLPTALRLGLEPAEVTHKPVPVPGGFRIASLDGEDPSGRLSSLSSLFEAVVVDCGRDWSRELVHTSDGSVVVLPTTVPGSRSARLWLETFPDQPSALVLNRIGPGGEARRQDLEALLGRRIALELPCSRRLRDAEDGGHLLRGPSLWTHRLERLARALFLT